VFNVQRPISNAARTPGNSEVGREAANTFVAVAHTFTTFVACFGEVAKIYRIISTQAAWSILHQGEAVLLGVSVFWPHKITASTILPPLLRLKSLQLHEQTL